MDLLERYLQSVKCHLDGKDRDDILRELAGNLKAEIEDRETALGRPLTEAETEALLTAHGHPAVVAARYRPEQGQVVLGKRIIGPELFRDYRRILLIFGIADLAVGVILALMRVRPLDVVMWGVVRLFAFQIVSATLVFAVAQRNLTRYPERWAGTKLATRQVSRPQLMVEIAALAVLGMTWLALPAHPELREGAATLAGGPGWATLRTAIPTLAAVQIALALISLVRPAWTFRVLSRMATHLLAIVVALMCRAAGPWFIASGEERSIAFDRLADLLNRSFNVIAFVVIGVSAALLIREALQLRRPRAIAPANEVVQPGRSR